MKFFFTIIILFISILSFSQQSQIGIDTSIWLKSLSLRSADISVTPVYPQAKLSHVLPNGNAVYKLPQDNMPCIVPDSSRYNYNMPVIRGEIVGNMPNASPRMQLIPKKKN